MPCPRPLPLDASAPPSSRRGVEVPGYTGYVPKKKPGNVFGATFKSANDAAEAGVKTAGPSTIINTRTTEQALRETKSLPGQEVPGYAGHIPRKGPENIFGRTFREANEDGLLGDHDFTQDRLCPVSEYPRGREHIGEIPSNIDHVPRKGRQFISSQFNTAGSYGKRHESARYFYDGGTPKEITSRTPSPQPFLVEDDLKKSPTNSTRSGSSRGSAASPAQQRRKSPQPLGTPTASEPSEDGWPNSTNARDDGVSARNDIGMRAPWPPRGMSHIARTAQKGRYSVAANTRGEGKLCRSSSPMASRARRDSPMASTRSLSPGLEIPGYSGYVPKKANVYGSTFRAANDRAASSQVPDMVGTMPRRVQLREEGSDQGQDPSSPALGVRSFSAEPRSARLASDADSRPAPLGREAIGEIPSHIDHVPRKGSRGLTPDSVRRARNEDRASPLGREAIGEIPSHIEHVPRKRRTFEANVVGPKPKSRSLSPEFDRIPGYTGHVPHKDPENIYGITYAAANDQAAGGPESPASRSPSSRFRPTDAPPGYSGYIAKKGPGNVFGATFKAANERADTGADPVASSRTESQRFMREPLHVSGRTPSPSPSPSRKPKSPSPQKPRSPAPKSRSLATANAD